MNNKLHQEAVQRAVEGRFRGHQAIRSKVIPAYPESAEREFRRIMNGYMRLLNQTLKEHMPTIMNAYKLERNGGTRLDDTLDLDGEVRRELQKVAEELEQKLAAYGLDDLVRKVAKLSQTTTLREWKHICKETLGIDLMADYYKSDFYEEALRRWVDENVRLIKSIEAETLGKMREIIRQGYTRGMSITDIQKAIREEYSVTRSKAKMLARDQISTLNAQVSKLQQQDAGCTKYRWSTSKDSRVRDCHKALDGKIFSWDDPPEMWYETKKAGRVYTGRRCHPGEDYACRCVAIPVFDYSTIDPPISEAKQTEGA